MSATRACDQNTHKLPPSRPEAMCPLLAGGSQHPAQTTSTQASERCYIKNEKTLF